MKTDAELEEDVVAELTWESSHRDLEIEIEVRDGVVRLSGVVDTCAQKHAAASAVERVAGVRAIRNMLAVSGSRAVR